MTYQAPAFMVAHPASRLPLSAISTKNVSVFTDDSKRALIDSKQSETGSFTSTNIQSGIVFSWVGLSPPRVNRIVIPAGHTFDGFTVQAFSDDDTPNFPSSLQRYSQAQTGAGIIDMAFSLVTTDIDWIVRVLDSVNLDVFSLSEIWLGERKALTTNDARVDPGAERDYEHDVTEEDFGGHTASLELSPPRRRFSLKIRGLDPAQADFAKLDEVIRDGRTSPFWYWTPDTTDTGPYLVKLTRSAVRRQTFSKPMTKLFYEVDLEMLEQL